MIVLGHFNRLKVAKYFEDFAQDKKEKAEQRLLPFWTDWLFLHLDNKLDYEIIVELIETRL